MFFSIPEWCQNAGFTLRDIMGYLREIMGYLRVPYGFAKMQVLSEYGIFLISHFSPTTSDEIPIKMLKLSSFCISPTHSDLVVSIRNSEFKSRKTL